MADRTDIDALLISALYGELTPAEEARMIAHLESHPADRTALADLTRTRQAIRDSRALAMIEPPQSVSALLLQEAARWSARPTRSPAASDERAAGWFHRLTRSFLAHPAMAVAAMFVVVVGVAGALYVRRGDQLAEMTAAPAAERSTAAAPAAPEPATTASASVTAAGSSAAKRDEVLRQAGAADEQPQAEPAALGSEAKDQAAGRVADHKAAPVPAPRAYATPPPARPQAAKKASGTGIELRTRELMPKDLDDDEPARRDTDKAKAGRAAVAPSPAKPAASDAKPSAGGAANADGLVERTPPPPPDGPKLRGAAPKRELAEEKSAGDNPLLAWARSQHEQVVSLVKANNCRAAATAAVEIYSRTPDYYTANVANDRSVKPCLPYLDSERDREDRKLAAKRATANEAPTAGPASPAATSPAAAAPSPATRPAAPPRKDAKK